MIKINLTSSVIDTIKKKHFDFFTRKRGRHDKDPSLLDRLVEKGAHSTGETQLFYHYLLSNYRTILLGTPNELQAIVDYIESSFSSGLVNALADSNSELAKDVTKVFYYEGFKNDKHWSAYDFNKLLNVTVCPYCNRQYISTYIADDGSGRTRPALDHFWDKGTHPYLGISLFNLIPSCTVCNSSLKGTDKFNIRMNIHPYIEGFEDLLLFSIDFKRQEEEETRKAAIDSFLSKGKGLELKLVKKGGYKKDLNTFRRVKKAEVNAKSFKLIPLYSTHTDHIEELLQKARAYDEAKIEDLRKSLPGAFQSKQEVLRLVTGNYMNNDEFGKRVLSKFMYDIANELGITDYL